MGAGTTYVNEQNELLYFTQALSNGCTLIINVGKAIYNFLLKPVNLTPVMDSSHLGF